MKRLFGKRKRTWEDNTKTDLKDSNIRHTVLVSGSSTNYKHLCSQLRLTFSSMGNQFGLVNTTVVRR
jgi:N12 class adenine-specific DNA methylase